MQVEARGLRARQEMHVDHHLLILHPGSSPQEAVDGLLRDLSRGLMTNKAP